MSNLNKEYKREGVRYYITIKQEIEKNELELKMLSRNHPAMLLPLEVRNQDGVIYFYYDITKEKSLDKIVEKTALSYKEIHMLFETIFEAIEMTKEYFLESDSLVFEEELIYKQKQQYRFIYVPGQKKNIVTQIKNLVTYLMDKIDHEDQEAVVYIYGMYRIVREGNFDIQSLKDLGTKNEENPYTHIMEQHKKQKEEWYEKTYENERRKRKELEAEEREEEEENSRLDGEIQEDGKGKSKRTANGKQQKREQRNGRTSKKETTMRGVVLILLGLLLAYEGYYIYGKAPSMAIQLLCIGTFAGFVIYFIFLIRWIKKRREMEHMEQLFSKLGAKEEQKVSYSNETMPLDRAYEQKKMAKLCPLFQGDEYPIFLTKQQFTIGNMTGNADGKIDKRQVSRIHALFEKKERTFTVKDLKSTNGTSVNGILLREDEKVELRDGDEIEFGDCAYLFELLG